MIEWIRARDFFTLEESFSTIKFFLVFATFVNEGPLIRLAILCVVYLRFELLTTNNML